MAVAPPSTPTLDPLKPSKKQKKGEKAELETQTTAQEQGEKKRKKKHRGEDATEQEVATPAQAADVVERPKKKRKSEPAASSTNEDTPVESNEAAPAEASSSAKPKREKRPKKPKDKSAKIIEPKPEPVSIKYKINIVNIPAPYTNPLIDESLPEVSQRGLAYAYQYAQHISLPSDSERATRQAWKFNKCRQNWILRNVTNVAVIPDPYLSLAMVYVTSIKGGALDSLKKTCKTTMREAKAAKSSDPSPEQPVESSNPTEAQPPSKEPEEPASKKVTFTAETAEPPSSIPSKEARRRAKAIIRILKGKLQPEDV